MRGCDGSDGAGVLSADAAAVERPQEVFIKVRYKTACDCCNDPSVTVTANIL